MTRQERREPLRRAERTVPREDKYASLSTYATPGLPKTEEEFHALLRHALDLGGDAEAEHLLSLLTGPLWERLHWWTRREKEEREHPSGRRSLLILSCDHYPSLNTFATLRA
jgi:hypothetical protein